jgi:NADPH-dependent curcumin reductase CurA
MHERVSRQVRLKSRPSGIPQAEHFEIVEVPVPDLSDGQVLVRNIYLSVEPAMRGWVSAVANYSEPVAVGGVMRSLAVGRVEESRNSDFHPGDYLTGMFGWQDYAVVDAAAIERKVGGSGVPVSTSLGVLGLNGLTAYFALLEIGQPKAGETVVVSTAAGAVGSCVGQIAKIKGCRTVGIAGGPDKVRICREDFRYDSAVDSHGWSSAAQRRSRAGIRHPRDRGSSVIFSSNARECRAFSSLTMSSATARHCVNSRAGCATDRSAIGRTSSTESSRHRVRSQGCTEARISVSV